MSGGWASPLLAAVLVAVLWPLAAADAAGGVAAVATPGTATLTMCRDWIVYESCSDYHNVAVPAVVSDGDKVRLHFGSNPKTYDFHVVGIHRHGGSCTVLSDRTGRGESGEKLVVSPCRAAASPAASRQP